MCGIRAYAGCLPCLTLRHRASQNTPAWLRASYSGKGLLSQEDWDKTSSHEMTLSGHFMINLLHSIFCRANSLSHLPFYSRGCFPVSVSGEWGKQEIKEKERKASPFSASSQDGREDKMSMIYRCRYGYRSGYR